MAEPISINLGDLQGGDEPAPAQQNLGRSLQQSLIGVAGAFAGSAFEGAYGDPNLGKAFRKMASGIQNTLQDRWWKDEFQRFQKTKGAAYQSQSEQLWNDYNTEIQQLDTGLITNPDGSFREIDPNGDEALQRRTALRQRLFQNMQTMDISLLNAIAENPTNPYMGKMAQQLAESRSQVIQQMLGAYPAVIAEEGAEAGLEAKRMEPELIRSQTESFRAGAERERAQTAQIRKETSGIGEIGPPPEVPLNRVDQWVTATEAGRKASNPFRAQGLAILEENIRQAHPQGDFEDTKAYELRIQNLVLARANEAEDFAVGAYLSSSLPEDKLQVVKNMPNMRKYFEQPSMQPREEPEINAPMTQQEVRESVIQKQKIQVQEGENIVEKLDDSLGDQSLKALDDTIRQVSGYRTFRSPMEAIQFAMRESIIPTMNRNIGDFPGADKVRAQFRNEIMQYLVKNWNKSENTRFMQSLFKEKKKKSFTKGLIPQEVLETGEVGLPSFPGASLIERALRGE